MIRRIFIAWSLFLALVTLGIGAVSAQTLAATGTRLTVQDTPRVDENGNIVKGQLVLTATLTTTDGKPVSDQRIQFYEKASFMGGEREALLGTATTDSNGAAAIQYQPAHTGTDTIVVRFASNGGYQATESQLQLDVTDVVPPFTSEPAPFATVGTGLSIAFALLVVGTWAALLGTLLRSITGIRAAARASGARAAANVSPSNLAESRR